MTNIEDNLKEILQEIRDVSLEFDREPPLLVAISKTKSSSMIMEAYNCGQHYFGENYIQELYKKSKELEHAAKSILWSFVGHLQTNKVPMLLQCPNLDCLETVDTIKLASALQKELNKPLYSGKRTLKVMIQVNTSGESQKYGVNPSQVGNLEEHIRINCPSLVLIGLMTIGSVQDSEGAFQSLINCKQILCKSSSESSKSELLLSMGMSGDFKLAIKYGADRIRIGSSIFGARQKKIV